MPEIDLDTIRHALKTAREHGMSSVKLRQNGATFRAVLNLEEESVDEFLSPESGQEAAAPASFEIVSPLVGYFSEAATLLTPGLPVEKGAVVAIVTALGLPNEVVAGDGGIVEELLVKPGEPVEYGQTIARLRKDL